MKKNELREKDFDPFIDNNKHKTKELNTTERKKSNKKEKRNNLMLKRIDKVDVILSLVFVVMFVITAILGYKVVAWKSDNKNYVKSSIIIPVLGSDTNNEISVDISNMKKGEERDYSFKVANNKDNNINQEEVLYAVQLLGIDYVQVEVYKNGNSENILPENNIILDNKLVGEEEQTDTYTLKIKANKKTNKQQLITIRVIS